ncbi:hypothetical protein GCM10009839_33510 [Catenulispora yoronensis]|uniref:DUF4263 domain-containing protein n=1 Tax=Catenulispora yoronensis TaxID=450799 RepID=A0ABP5FSB1_9ACTN
MQRELSYDIQVQDEYVSWRDWLDEQLAQLPEGKADTLAGRLWQDEFFWSVIFELAAGAALRRAGFSVAYEQPLDGRSGLTPDWTVTTSGGQPLFLVEVHTDDPSKETFAQMRAWHHLVEAIKKIPVSVVLQLAATEGPPRPPEAGTAKKIAAEVQQQLLSVWNWSQPAPIRITSHGYTFLVMGDPRLGGRAMDSPLGMHAAFDPPTSRAGMVSADKLLARVADKVSKYRQLADRYGLPLAIAVGAHKFTGVTLETVDYALNGAEAPMITMQFGAGDTHIGDVTVQMGPVKPWPMPPDLAALLWIDHAFPFEMTVRPNMSARRSFPDFGQVAG